MTEAYYLNLQNKLEKDSIIIIDNNNNINNIS